MNKDTPIYSLNDLLETYHRIHIAGQDENALNFISELTGRSTDSLFEDLSNLTLTEPPPFGEQVKTTEPISKELIKDGIRAKIIEFVIDPNMEHGTVCQIGDSWFYFGGQTAEELNPEDFIKNIPEEDIINEIYDILEEFRNDEDSFDEWSYYDSVLTYRNDN